MKGVLIELNRGKDLVKNTAILTVGKMCTQIVSFLLLPLYTALLSTEETGVVDLFTTYISLLLPLVCFQLDQGLFRFMLDYRQSEDKIKSLFTSIAFLNFVQCSVLAILYYVFAVRLNFIVSDYKLYLLIAVVLNVFSSLFMQFARGLGKMKCYSIGSFLTAASTVALNVIFVAVLKMGAHGMFIATMCGIFFNCVYLFFSLKAWKYLDIRTFDKGMLKEVCAYSFPLIPNQISGWILSASDRTIISGFLNVAANGCYSVANKFSNLLGTFYGFFNLAWVESVSLHFNDEDRDDYINETIQTVTDLFVSISAGIIAVMPFLFPVMVNQQYGQAYGQIPILLIAMIFQILVGLYSAVYIALKKPSTIARTTIAGAIINVVINLALIKTIGLYSASISTLISYSCTALYRRVNIRKYVKIRENKKHLSLNLIMISVAIVSYYVESIILRLIVLAVVIVYMAFINKCLIKVALSEIKRVFKL